MLLLMIWDFIQNQILGMQWLGELIGTEQSTADRKTTHRIA